MKLLGWDRQKRSVAAIYMHAKHLKILTAVCFPRQTRGASATEIIRLHRAKIPRFQAAAHGRGNYFNTKLVPKPPRIAEKRLLAGECMQIGPADPATPDTRQRLGWIRLRRPNLRPRQNTRRLQEKSFQVFTGRLCIA